MGGDERGGAFGGRGRRGGQRSYRYEQGFTFELNLAGAGDRARQAFVNEGRH
jgi:hypothetical protein